MSKPEAQNEPTMEEILASIRRIISEDEPEEGKEPKAAPAEAEKPAAPAEAPKPAAAPAPKAAPASQPKGADNILDLTKMVAEDGTIVDLEAEKAAMAMARVTARHTARVTARHAASDMPLSRAT